jgi:iron complex transport system substrate-binding protein
MVARFDWRLRLPATRAAERGRLRGRRRQAGAGSLADAALAAAGLRNMAGEYRVTRSGRVPLELLVGRPPDLIVLSSVADAYSTVVADNLRHPALQALRRHRASIELPWQLALCGTPHVADAIARLAEARAAIEATRP